MYNIIVKEYKGEIMTKYAYMKLLGLFLVVVGFSYCLTSFSNFYAYIFGDIEIANANVVVMCMGLLFPLYMFIFGVFFYFYTDKQFAYINPWVLGSGIFLLIGGILRLFINYGIMEFIHISFAYVLILFASLIIFGCFRFKY